MNQPFIGHVQELRRRLTWSALVVLLGSGLAYIWHSELLGWLQAPLRQSLYYSKVTGAFEFLIQICLLVGVLLAAPMIMYQLIAFIRPALSKPLARLQIVFIISLATVLILCGVAFGYFISLPAALHFLSTIDTSHLHPLLAADSYLSFVINYLAVFGLAFLLPLILALIDRITPLPPATLGKARKWIIIGAFSAALILPIAPDPVSQALLAIPVICLYEISIWIIWIHHRSVRRRSARLHTITPALEATVTPVHAPAAKLRPVRRQVGDTSIRRTPQNVGGGQVIDLRGR